MKTLLDITSLSVSYGSTVAFKEISFTIIEGESVAIIGRSGCGKST
ncbi:MAG: ATP-binding cassette domain-containing protein, partial [Spirochaetia bacterium]|nr:ATP-binding cassette domain-containing protein [Spirochaetia bacterium]